MLFMKGDPEQPRCGQYQDSSVSITYCLKYACVKKNEIFKTDKGCKKIAFILYRFQSANHTATERTRNQVQFF